MSSINNNTQNIYLYNNKYSERLKNEDVYTVKIKLKFRIANIANTIIGAFANLISLKSNISTMDYLKEGFNIAWNGRVKFIKTKEDFTSTMIRIDKVAFEGETTLIKKAEPEKTTEEKLLAAAVKLQQDNIVTNTQLKAIVAQLHYNNFSEKEEIYNDFDEALSPQTLSEKKKAALFDTFLEYGIIEPGELDGYFHIYLENLDQYL